MHLAFAAISGQDKIANSFKDRLSTEMLGRELRSQTVGPKQLPPLTEAQTQISNDFMRYWHEVLPRKYSSIDQFNHGYPVRAAQSGFLRTLEIGAGLGEHLQYETLTAVQ